MFEENMEINVDLDEVERFIEEELVAVLLENTSFENTAFILQAAVNLLEEAKGMNEEN
ncbi:MAG: hypothetical protein IKB70_07445 [Bacilli bacterium]|nr:hypothetical protein [Bacilli bacterium]